MMENQVEKDKTDVMETEVMGLIGIVSDATWRSTDGSQPSINGSFPK